MRRLLIPLIIVVVLVGVGVVLGIAIAGGNNTPSAETAAIPRLMTVEILITATTDPNATVPVRIITATPPPGSIGALPTGILSSEETAEADQTAAVAPTLDPVLLGADAALQETVTALPENCILHTIGEGDTPFAVAEIYGASGFDLLEVNGLDELAATQLQIGDVLIVPLEGCSLTAADLASADSTDEAGAETSAASTEDGTAEATAEATGDATEEAAATARPTITLPPTAVNAQVTIVQVISPGDITSEAVEIRNTGGVVDMTGWVLSDGDGNEYTFNEQRLFTNGAVTVYTRTGTDTPIARYWGRSQAVFGEDGDTVTLFDASGEAQSSLRLGEAATTPTASN